MAGSDSSASEFRPVQYLGSKWRILDQIAWAVASVSIQGRPGVLDLFSGSGVVARHLAQLGPVMAADIQEYSRVISSALLDPGIISVDTLIQEVRHQSSRHRNPWLDSLVAWERESGSETRLERLATAIESGSMVAASEAEKHSWPELQSAIIGSLDEASNWTLLRHYGGVYFSYRQAADLDLIATVVRRLPEDLRDTGLAALLSTASDLVTSVGNHFAQPIRPRTPSGFLKHKQLELIASSRQRSAIDVFAAKLSRFTTLAKPRFESFAIRSSFDEALQSLPDHIGTIYADPPYTRDHYSRFYHVLETIALGDDPGISKVRVGGGEAPSRGLYRVDRHQSPFSIVSEAPAAFQTIFQAAESRGASLVLSYSPVPDNEKPRARVISIDALLALANEHFRHVTIHKALGMKHSKFNAASVNAPAVEEAEIIIACSN